MVNDGKIVKLISFLILIVSPAYAGCDSAKSCAEQSNKAISYEGSTGYAIAGSIYALADAIAERQKEANAKAE